MRHWLLTVVISIVISTSLLFTYHLVFYNKIGFVRTGEILMKYKGMISTNDQFQKEVALVQRNIDTLKSRYEGLRNQKGVSDREHGYNLGVAENEYRQYENSAKQQMEMRRQELAKGVLDRINKFIQDYGEKNRYDFILGSTNEGSLLKGRKSDDLTERILTELNAEYDINLSKSQKKNPNEN
jgi:outer membrane protein